MKKHDPISSLSNSSLNTIADGHKKTVLLVEDDATHRAFMKQILEDCGLKAVAVERGATALAMLDAGVPVDLIIMDWDMPGMNGLETTRQIRARQVQSHLQHIPILAFTGHRLPGDREKCLAAGMDAYLSKNAWLPKWRQTLVENLQSLINGNFNMEDIQDINVNQQAVHANFNPDEFNLSILRETKALLKGAFVETVEEYLQDAAIYISNIKDGLHEGDTEKVARNSHPLKSNSKGFGLMGLAGVAEAINLAALQAIENDASLDAAENLFPQLADTFARAEKKLRAQI